jgi:hypothetical protein
LAAQNGGMGMGGTPEDVFPDVQQMDAAHHHWRVRNGARGWAWGAHRQKTSVAPIPDCVGSMMLSDRRSGYHAKGLKIALG